MSKTGKTKALFAMFLAAAALQAGTAFGAQAAAGSQLQAGTWVKEAAGWKFRKPSGEMATGWIQTASGWYYLKPETGLMATGMLRINDKTYYFNAASDAVQGKMATGWYQDEKGSWYFFSTTADSTEGAAVTGWQWVDGKSYYFEPSAGDSYGRMFAGGVTPDGYKVNTDGQWVDENGKVQIAEGKGYASDPAKNKSTGTTVRSGNGDGGSSSSNTGNNASDNNNAGNNNNSNNTNNSNNSNNNDSSKDDSDNNADQTKSVFVKEDETKLVEVNSLGWWITVAFEDGYNAGNTKVYADGVDVTAALSNVTDDGSICKLAVIKAPSELTVSNAADSAKTQTIFLDDEAADGVIYTGSSYLPEKILAHGPVALWDYYLTNYADDGSVRYSPSKTTFALGQKASAHPAYSPDAELGEDGKAAVTIMFNYNTDDEKEWFDGINRLQLVEYNENKNTINSDLVFDRAKNVAHGSGRVGELTIKTGQSNFTNNGRYYVRVQSKAGTSALVPIHVVNAQAPVFKLKETPQSGENLHFQVENMVYGIETPINRVVLEGPTETVELKEIEDWFLFSQDLFVLYNDKVDHFKYKGDYKLTVYADGFKSTSIKFTVTKGKNVPSKDEMGIAQYSFDGVSTASTGSGGSSGSGESGSGSMAISANLVFDTDLLVNANILKEVGKSTAESEAVIDWWYGMAGADAVFNKNDRDDQYYDWVDYIHTVESSKNTGIIPFEDYKAKGFVWNNSPATAKEVLEDGLLGEIRNNGDFSRPAAGAFTVEQNKENKDVLLKHEDKTYLAAIKKILMDNNWTGLTKEQYTVDPENGTLILNKSLFTPGQEYKITVEADGYQTNAFKITYDQILEEGLSLTVKYKDGKTSYVSEKRTFGQIQGFYADAQVEVTGSEGGFLKYLTSVVLDEDDTILTKGYEGSDAAYYEISEDKKNLVIGNMKPGTHTLTLRAKGYADPLKAEITVEAGMDEPENTFTPVVKSLEYKPAGTFAFMNPANYFITFDNGTDTDFVKALAAYLNAVTSVEVGNVTYTKANLGIGSDPDKFAADAVNSAYGGTDCLRMTVDSGFNGDASLTITVYAKDYADLTFTVIKNSEGKYVLGNGSDVNPPAETEKDAPALTGQVSIAKGTKLEMAVAGDAEEAAAYLNAITAVKNGNGELNVEKVEDDYKVIIDTTGLESGSTTLVIEATGYKDKEIEVTVGSDEDGSDDVEDGISFEKVQVKDFWDSYEVYRLKFTENNILGVDRDVYLGAINYIMVGTEKYEYGYSLSSGSNKYKAGATDTSGMSGKDYIDFTTDGFDSYESGDLIKVTIYSNKYDPYVFYVRDGKLVDSAEAEEELLDEQEMKAAAEDPIVDESNIPSEDEVQTPAKDELGKETKNEVSDNKKSENDVNPGFDESSKEDKDESKDDSAKEPENPSESEDGSDESKDSDEKESGSDESDESEGTSGDNNSEESDESGKEGSEKEESDSESGESFEETETDETEGEI